MKILLFSFNIFNIFNVPFGLLIFQFSRDYPIIELNVVQIVQYLYKL
jgi:hypothetical protein